jgi:protein-tyrosine phosphatase
MIRYKEMLKYVYTMEDIESNIYQLVKSAPNDVLFVLISKHEIDLLQGNNIRIKGIHFHYHNSWRYSEKIIETYEDKKYENYKEIYLLGSTYDLYSTPTKDNVHLEKGFNSLKYLHQYSDQIIFNESNRDPDDNNADFIDALKSKYKTSLFYCLYNTGILGVEGYLPFHEEFFTYVDTLESIYIINFEYRSNKFLTWLAESEHKHKIIHLNVHVGRLFQTNPELIAYYRVPMNTRAFHTDYYLDTYCNFNNQTLTQTLTKIEDQITIGTDSYTFVNYQRQRDKDYKEWFPEKEITHILNVSNDVIELHQIPNPKIVYEHIPIDEREKCQDKTKGMLYKAADRLYELMQDPKNHIYVHCSLGVNRSPSVVLLYYIKYRGMSLFDAYKTIASQRRIFTSVELFKILYAASLEFDTNTEKISPLKLRTHYAYNFCEPGAYMFALYDLVLLEQR